MSAVHPQTRNARFFVLGRLRSSQQTSWSCGVCINSDWNEYSPRSNVLLRSGQAAKRHGTQTVNQLPCRKLSNEKSSGNQMELTRHAQKKKELKLGTEA
jgi:hypothetical protein